MEQNNALARKFNAASLLRFALPNIAMMMLLSMYTIVDGMFISRFAGTTALSAINMSYPLNCLQMATGIMLGTGGSAIIARRQGEGRTDEARRNFTMLIAVALGIGLIFTVFGNLFLNPILRLLGTSELQWADCLIYTRIQLVFAPMLFLQTAFQTLFVTAGKPGLGLLTSVGGGITNVVLDWLFMGPMNMGVAGAAIATCLGYCVPSIVGLVYFTKNRTGSLYFVPFKFDGATLAAACGNGSSEMVSNIANAITTFVFNTLFMRYRGEDGVAAITIAMYFQFVFTAVYFGFSMGVAPVISYKFGEKNIPQLRHIFRICMTFVLACSLGTYVRDCHARLSDLCGQLPAHGHEYFRVLAVYRALGWSRVCDHLVFAHACVSRGDAAAPAADFAGNRHLAGCSGSRGARRDGFGVFSRQGTEKVSVLRERVLLREQHSFVIYR